MLAVIAALVPALLAHTAAAANAARPQRCPAAQDVVERAGQLCSGSEAVDSLRAVGATVPLAAKLLGEHGFRTAIDLQLLDPQSEEAAELIGLMRAAGVSIADRSKVRLLIGRRAGAGATGGTEARDRTGGRPRGSETTLAGANGRPRQLQGSAGAELSMDTVLFNDMQAYEARIARFHSMLIGVLAHVVRTDRDRAVSSGWRGWLCAHIDVLFCCAELRARCTSDVTAWQSLSRGCSIDSPPFAVQMWCRRIQRDRRIGMRTCRRRSCSPLSNSGSGSTSR
eukprot:SAG31_NODE_567_length_14028_cov_4.022328_1_plen_282_part_00